LSLLKIDNLRKNLRKIYESLLKIQNFKKTCGKTCQEGQLDPKDSNKIIL